MLSAKYLPPAYCCVHTSLIQTLILKLSFPKPKSFKHFEPKGHSLPKKNIAIWSQISFTELVPF